MKQETLNLTAFSKKETRRELDFYPTPPEATIALMEFLKLGRSTIIVEPACGDLSMVKVLNCYVDKVIYSDIRMGVDYLTTPMQADAIITNPPFNLSQKFIEKALTEAGIVAMLLKSQYWHAKARFDFFNQHPPSYVLPLTWRPDFLFNARKEGEKGSPTMEVAWSVWVVGKENKTTQYIPLRKCEMIGDLL